MTRFSKFLLVSFGFLIFVFAVNYWGTYEEQSYRQRLTVVVEAGGKLYSGSSVTSVTAIIAPLEKWTPISSNSSGFKRGGSGEAVVVALPNGEYLFALLRGEIKSYGAFDEMALLAFPEAQDRRDAMQAYRFFASAPAGTKADVPRKAYPLLVTFGDINDPASVKRVDPDDLAMSFGPGYALKSITLELTNESKTEGQFERLLPCFNSNKACVPLNRALAYSDPMANILNQDFRR